MHTAKTVIIQSVDGTKRELQRTQSAAEQPTASTAIEFPSGDASTEEAITELTDATKERQERKAALKNTIQRHEARQRQESDRPLRQQAEQLAASLGLEYTPATTVAEINTAAENAAASISDSEEEDLVYARAERLIRLHDQLYAESERSLQEVNDILAELGVDNNASAQQIVEAADEVAQRTADMTGEPLIKVQTEKRALAREAIRLLNDEKGMPAYSNEPQQKKENVFGEAPTILDEMEEATKRMQRVAAAQEQRIESGVDEVETNVVEKTGELSLAEKYREMQDRIVELNVQVEGLRSDAENLRQQHEQSKESQGRLASLFRRFLAPKSAEASTPKAREQELKKSEEALAQAEKALLAEEHALIQLIEQAENLAKDMIREVQNAEGATEALSTEREARKTAEYTAVQTLTAEQLQQQKEAAINTLYEMAGSARPSSESWQREAARMTGMETVLEKRYLLPAEKTSQKGLSELVTNALANEYDKLKTEGFGADVANDRLARLRESMQAGGIDITSADAEALLQKAYESFQEDVIQSRLDQKAQALRDQSSIVRLNELGLQRRNTLDSVRMGSMAMDDEPLTPDMLETAKNEGLLTDNEIKQLLAIDRRIGELQQRLYPGQAKKQPRNNMRRQNRRVELLSQASRIEQAESNQQSLADERALDQLEELDREKRSASPEAQRARREAIMASFAQNEPLNERRDSNTGESYVQKWQNQITESPAIQAIAKRMSQELRKTKSRFTESTAPENDAFNIIDSIKKAGPDPKKLVKAARSIAGQLILFVDVQRAAIQSEIEDALIAEYDSLAGSNTLIGSELGGDQRSVWEEQLEERAPELAGEIKVLARNLPTETLGSDENYLRKNLVQETDPAKIQTAYERVKRMITQNDGITDPKRPDRNTQDALDALERIMDHISESLKKAAA
jgi:hypothetical protein